MSDGVQKVTITIDNPSPGDPGRCAIGYYRVDGDVLTMTDPSGALVLDRNGERYSHKLGANDNARTIAGRLTRRIMREVTQALGSNNGFGKRRLVYPDLGII